MLMIEVSIIANLSMIGVTMLNRTIQQVTNTEIKPFIPALNILLSRLDGLLDTNHPDLAFIDKLNSLKDAHLLSHVLTMSFLQVELTNESNELWDIRLESYQTFQARSKQLSTRVVGFESEQLQPFYMWFISLCSWESDFISTNSH